MKPETLPPTGDRKLRFMTVSLFHPQVLKGGAQYVAKDLHDAALADPEVEPVMLAGIDAGAFPQYDKVGAAITGLPDGDREYLLLGRNFDDFYQTMYDPRRIKAITHFLEAHRPDVIHVHHSIWIGLEFLKLARKVLPAVKILYTLHEYVPICYARGQLMREKERSICTNTAPDQCTKCFPQYSPEAFFLRRRNFKEAFKLVDHFISPSVHLKQRFVEWGLDDQRISVIANGHHRLRPAKWQASHSPDLNVFGFFGQFIDAKGIDVLLAAAAQAAKEHPIEIRIFGGNKEYASDSYVAKIDDILAKAPETLTVVEIGPYSRDSIFDLMASVDWVVVPSVWPETFALVVSEAWDAKRPVLASRAGGLQDRVIDGQNGMTFAPGSVSQLSNLLLACVGNDDLWSSIVENMQDEISITQAWKSHKALMQSLSDPDNPSSSLQSFGRAEAVPHPQGAKTWRKSWIS